jgi:hypothetical protein
MYLLIVCAFASEKDLMAPPTATSPTSSSGTNSNSNTSLITVQEMTVEPKFAVSLPVCVPYCVCYSACAATTTVITAQATARYYILHALEIMRICNCMLYIQQSL